MMNGPSCDIAYPSPYKNEVLSKYTLAKLKKGLKELPNFVDSPVIPPSIPIPYTYDNEEDNNNHSCNECPYQIALQKALDDLKIAQNKLKKYESNNSVNDVYMSHDTTKFADLDRLEYGV